MLALVPLVVARRLAPAITTGGPGSLAGSVRAAPLAMACGLLCGIAEGAAFALLPLYGLAHEMARETAVVMGVAFAAGAVLLQPPTGWLADRMPHERLLAGTVAVALVCIALMPAAIGAGWAVWPVLFVWGGAVAGLYTLGLILIGQRFAVAAPGAGRGDLAGANAGLIMAYTMGSMLGPALGGGAMEVWPPEGLMAVLGVAFALFLAATLRLLRLLRRVGAKPVVLPAEP